MTSAWVNKQTSARRLDVLSIIILVIIFGGLSAFFGVHIVLAFLFLVIGFTIMIIWKPIRLFLYLYVALIWLLPRLYLPGFGKTFPLHVLMLAGLGLFWAADFVNHSNRTIPPLMFLVVAYFIGGLIAFVFGMPQLDTLNGIKFLAEACIISPLLYVLVWTYVGNGDDAERFLLILAISIAVLGIGAYLLQGSSIWTPTVYEKAGLRLSGQYQYAGLYVIVTPVLLSTQLSMLIPVTLGIALNAESSGRRYLAFSLLFIFAYLILLAGGRAGWLGSLVGSGIVLLFSIRRGKSLIPRYFLISFFIVSLFITLVSFDLVNEEIKQRLFSLFSLFDSSTVQVRYPLWAKGLELIRQHPLGIGFQAFYSITGYSAHSSYILWGLGTGIGGLIIILWFIGSLLIRSIKFLLHGYNISVLCAVGGIVGALLSITGDNISRSVGWTQTTFWILLSMLASSFNTTTK